MFAVSASVCQFRVSLALHKSNKAGVLPKIGNLYALNFGNPCNRHVFGNPCSGPLWDSQQLQWWILKCKKEWKMWILAYSILQSSPRWLHSWEVIMIPPPDNFLLSLEDIFRSVCYFFQLFYYFSIVNCTGQIKGFESV